MGTFNARLEQKKKKNLVEQITCSGINTQVNNSIGLKKCPDPDDISQVQNEIANLYAQGFNGDNTNTPTVCDTISPSPLASSLASKTPGKSPLGSATAQSLYPDDYYICAPKTGCA
jgi:hypothetical protein